MTTIDFFSAQSFEAPLYNILNETTFHFSMHYIESHLNRETAHRVKNVDVVCCFVNDHLDRLTLDILKANGVKLIALRSAGFNHVDTAYAASIGLPVCYVPRYSPEAVAEFTVGLILSLNRKIHRAYQRVREGNFSLQGLMGFNLRGKTVGIVGLGAIGGCLAHLLMGFGCRVLAYDIVQNPAMIDAGVEYFSLSDLLNQSDIVSLHCPFTKDTKHLICTETIEQMKPGVMLINTGRGALIDTRAVINGLKNGKIGYLGMDVYEEEAPLFFADHSTEIIQDDVICRLMTFPNVLITGHQAFFTQEAIQHIAETTLNNISYFKKNELKKIFLVSS